MLRYARRQLPACRMVLYTNGDKLTAELCCTLEALDLDTLIWDCYDDRSARRVPAVIADSSLDPARVRVNDYRRGFPSASSRCSAVRAADTGPWRDKPCGMPDGKLFFTDDGKGGSCWLLCCECYDRKVRWPGNLSPVELNARADFARIRDGLLSGQRALSPACKRCDRDGGHPKGFGHVPALVDSGFWPVPAPVPAAPKGRRLVVLPVNARWAQHAAAVLDTIDRASVMPGKSLVLWGDDDQPGCPDFLRGDTREVWEFPGSLGWRGISRGIAKAFLYALREKYDWVIKLDTDTAILRGGWDAVLCSECPPDTQAGTYMDASITGQIPNNSDGVADGLFNGQLAAHCRWARRFVERGLRRWDHIQGGCYVIGAKALERIERVVGLSAEDQEHVPEEQRVGEDVYIDTKCKVAGIPQRDILQLRIWFREPRVNPLTEQHIMHQRDSLGVVAVHPVKDLALLRRLAEYNPLVART